MTYWDDVLKYMRGELKLNQLPKSLQQYSQVIRKLVDDQQEKILPILKDMKIKDDILKTWVDILKQVMKYLKIVDLEHQKKIINQL